MAERPSNNLGLGCAVGHAPLFLRDCADGKVGIRPIQPHVHSGGGFVGGLAACEIGIGKEVLPKIFDLVTNPTLCADVKGRLDVAH